MLHRCIKIPLNPDAKTNANKQECGEKTPDGESHDKRPGSNHKVLKDMPVKDTPLVVHRPRMCEDFRA